MFHLKRFLLLGSLGILLFAGLVFTLGPKAPGAHAACSQGCANNPCPPGLSESASSNNTSWVEVLQYALNSVETNASFTFSTYPLSIDGDFGAKTETAVVAYQHYANISNGGGAVGDRTWKALGFCGGNSHQIPGSVASGTTCPPGQSESSGTNDPIFVEAIQDLINQDYSVFGPSGPPSNFSDSSPDPWAPYLAPDGSFEAQTHNAVADWQAFKSISGGGGAVGDRTWRSLEMCF